MSAEACRQSILNSKDYFLKDKAKEERGAFEVPETSWFWPRRERTGLVSESHVWLKIAAAIEIIQKGFDESSIDQQSTLNPMGDRPEPGPNTGDLV